MDLPAQKYEVLTATGALARSDLETVHHNLDVDQQVNRLLVAKAIREAHHLAKVGKLSEARASLREAKALLITSPSAKEPLSVKLVQELDQSLQDLAGTAQYEEAGGDHEFARRWSGHFAERSNHVGHGSADYYGTSMRSHFKNKAMFWK